MIIQCEQCRTKFKLDDERISDRGVKVRCAKCRHVFTVHKPSESRDTVLSEDIIKSPEISFTPAIETPDKSMEVTSSPFEFTAQPEITGSDLSFDLGQTDASTELDFNLDQAPIVSEQATPTPVTFDFGEKTLVIPPKQQPEPATEINFDFGALPETEQKPVQEEAIFDFGDTSPQVENNTALNANFDLGIQQMPTAKPPAADFDLGGFDFGDSLQAPDTAVIQKTGAAGFDFKFDDADKQAEGTTSDSFDLSGIDFSQGQAPTPKKSTEVESFSLGELDLTSETSAVPVDVQTASTSDLFAPVDDSLLKKQEFPLPDITFDVPKTAEEAPPLAISSRRRQSSSSSIIIVLVAIIVMAILGYIAYNFIGGTSKSPALLNKGGLPAEEGNITVQNVKAYFIPKAAAGELLVITGDALNSFTKPRAAIQVKGVVFGDNNQAVVTKTVYAGNQLTTEQLMQMPADKIEAAMNNQFGDSLTNLELQPGKTIQFTIVIINPPPEGKEFAVEPFASTVAAAK